MALLETVSVVDALAQRLREQVLDGVVPAGHPVAETELAAEFGVSRPTAKGAITALVYEGLLRRGPHRSAYVPVLTREDVVDIYKVRIPLELEVVRTLAIRGTFTPALEAAFAELRRLPGDVSTSRFVAADLTAHRALVDHYGSPRLRRVYESLLGEIHLTMIQSRRVMGRERIAHEHADVLAQLRAADPDGAAEAMRIHLEGARDALAEAIASGASPVPS